MQRICFHLAAAFTLASIFALAQTPPPSASVPTQWEAQKKIDALLASLREVDNTLGHLNLEAWKTASAPPAYFAQFEGARRQLSSTRLALEELRGNHEKLALALEIFLRFEALDFMLDSVREAARKYDSPALSDELEAKLGAAFPARDSYRAFLLDLARERDQQFDVLHKEAQRCRVKVNTPPPPKRPHLTPSPITQSPAAPQPKTGNPKP